MESEGRKYSGQTLGHQIESPSFDKRGGGGPPIEAVMPEERSVRGQATEMEREKVRVLSVSGEKGKRRWLS